MGEVMGSFLGEVSPEAVGEIDSKVMDVSLVALGCEFWAEFLEFKLFLQNQKICHNYFKPKTRKINPVFIWGNVLNNFAPAKNFVAAITTLPLGHV